jgi:hypothetical protein
VNKNIHTYIPVSTISTISKGCHSDRPHHERGTFLGFLLTVHSVLLCFKERRVLPFLAFFGCYLVPTKYSLTHPIYPKHSVTTAQTLYSLMLSRNSYKPSIHAKFSSCDAAESGIRHNLVKICHNSKLHRRNDELWKSRCQILSKYTFTKRAIGIWNLLFVKKAEKIYKQLWSYILLYMFTLRKMCAF